MAQRPWYRLHLFTCFMIMPVACGLLFKNFTCHYLRFGWPMAFIVPKINYYRDALAEPIFLFGEYIIGIDIFYNLVINLSILALVGVTFECIIRLKMFKFSLMTAFVMMLTVSGLLWLNVNHTICYCGGSGLFALTTVVYGWPFGCWDNFGGPLGYWLNFLADVGIGLMAIIITGLICELLVRRQDRKRQLKQEGGK